MTARAATRGKGQQELRFRPRGGARRGAGRKARPERVGLSPHVARAAHHYETPVHVTARVVPAAPSLRSERIFSALRVIIARASEKGFRVVHFSVQGNHVHLIVEADDSEAFARGVQRLLSRIAMTVNAIARRSGRLWRDRHHREPVTSLRQMRNLYVYVLFNFRKHALASHAPCDAALVTFDECSSAFWFDGWSPLAPAPIVLLERAGPSPVVRAYSWLAASGWRRCGLIHFDEILRSA
jgi:putative transposase